MPAYQNTLPPISLFSGDVGLSFNNEAFPGGATSGSQFAIPSFTGLPDGGTAVRWQTVFGTAPTAVNMVLRDRQNPQVVTVDHRREQCCAARTNRWHRSCRVRRRYSRRWRRRRDGKNLSTQRRAIFR